MYGSAGQIALDNFESDAVRVMATGLAASGNDISLFSKGNMFKAMWANMAEATGTQGVWGFSRGGMGAITQAIAASAEERGATIRTGAEIEEILVEDGKAVGVVLTTGEVIRARAVASNADPKRTFLKLVPGENIQPGIKRDVQNLRMRGSLAKVFIALDKRPEWKCFEGEEVGTRDQGFLGLVPSIEFVEESRVQALRGEMPDKIWTFLHVQSLTDDSLAPPGKHAMTCYFQHVPYELAEGSWDDEATKQDLADRCLSHLREYMTNLDDIMIDYVVFGPRDIEDRFYLTEGHDAPRGHYAGPDVLAATLCGLFGLPDAGEEPVPVRVGGVSGWVGVGGAGAQCGAGDHQGLAGGVDRVAGRAIRGVSGQVRDLRPGRFHDLAGHGNGKGGGVMWNVQVNWETCTAPPQIPHCHSE